MTTEYNNLKSNSTRASAPQLLEARAIPVGMKLAEEIGFIAAIILQHFYYLLVEGYGKVLPDGDRWMHHPRWEWVAGHFSGLTEWQYRQGREKLKQLGLLKTCQPLAKEWDHTNYHTLDYERLKALILSIGEPPPIDWRATTNRLVSAHQSTKEAKQTPKQTSKTATGRAAAILDFEEEEKRLKPLLLSIGELQDESNLSTPASLPDQTELIRQKSKVTDLDKSSAAALPAVEKEKQDVVEAAGGIAINPQLLHQLMNYTLEQVKAAVSHYSAVKREKGERKNPAGWLTECLKGQWWLAAAAKVQEIPHPASRYYTAADFEVPNTTPPPASFRDMIASLKKNSVR